MERERREDSKVGEGHTTQHNILIDGSLMMMMMMVGELSSSLEDY